MCFILIKFENSCWFLVIKKKRGRAKKKREKGQSQNFMSSLSLGCRIKYVSAVYKVLYAVEYWALVQFVVV
jgi:hypothetical protein